MEKNTLYVPHDLIIQILLRLSVKSLLRFKCVRKSWLALISSTHFANSHLEITVTQSRRILFISTPDLETRSIDFKASITDDSASTSLSLNFLRPRPQYYFLVAICSCRGFIFLHHSTAIYLWNPSTRVYKQIPLSPIDSKFRVDNYFCYLYGFGYDQSRDDYLVVSISCDRNLGYNLDGDYYSRLEFFSLRDNTWNEIEGIHFPYMNAFDYCMVGSLFNGVGMT